MCEFDRWAPGNASHALYIADRESSFYPWSRNASSGCEGLYQHIASAWPPRTRSYLWRGWFAPWTWTPAGQDPDPGAEPWSDARANVIVAARMVAAGGWGPWGG